MEALETRMGKIMESQARNMSNQLASVISCIEQQRGDHDSQMAQMWSSMQTQLRHSLGPQPFAAEEASTREEELRTQHEEMQYREQEQAAHFHIQEEALSARKASLLQEDEQRSAEWTTSASRI